LKSIRLSLMVYSLLLLGAALLAVSLLAYRIASQSLLAKQQTNRQLLKAQLEERKHEENERLNKELLGHARALANMAQTQFESSRLPGVRFAWLGALSAAPSPNGHLVTPLWIGEFQTPREPQTPREFNPLAWTLNYLTALEIQLDEELLHRSEDRPTDLFQINRPRGRAFRSRSLGEQSLPYDDESFNHLQMLEWQHDDVELNGTQLRRVMLKAPLMRQAPFPGPRFERPRRDFSPSRTGERTPAQSTPADRAASPPTPPQPRPFVTPPIFIQCAAPRAELDATLADLEAQTNEELRQSDDEANHTLRSLGMRLAWISLAVFAAVCIGASVLVRAGLSPLHRLGEAVSRVSETNFTLRYVGPPPPAELVPIVERLEQTLAMLQRAFDREKQSTADISHELRTPLAGLMTTVDVALRKTRSAEEYREALTDCRDIIKQMSQLVERLLTLTWLDARSDAVRREPVDLAEMADQCAAVIRPLAKAHGLSLNVHKQAPIKIRTDPDKLREVVSNLLHNAVEYNRPDGSIDLTVRSSDSGLEVEVRDTGVGIAPEHRERIFERFFRADESRNAAGVHAGLGLAIVRGYVELLGGTISVESELGRGSTFRVRIPTMKNQHQG
jgi:signal transduction histidine kinase